MSLRVKMPRDDGVPQLHGKNRLTPAATAASMSGIWSFSAAGDMEQMMISTLCNNATRLPIESWSSAVTTAMPRPRSCLVLCLSLDEVRTKHVRSWIILSEFERRYDPESTLTNESSVTKASRICPPVSPVAPKRSTFCRVIARPVSLVVNTITATTLARLISSTFEWIVQKWLCRPKKFGVLRQR